MKIKDIGNLPLWMLIYWIVTGLFIVNDMFFSSYYSDKWSPVLVFMFFPIWALTAWGPKMARCAWKNMKLPRIGKERIGRLDYLIRSLGIAVVSFVLIVFAQWSLGDDPAGFLALLWITAYIWIAVIPRLRDMGRSPWWFLTIFIPLGNLILTLFLLFTEGESKEPKVDGGIETGGF